jgi:hypothetical protein
LGNQPRWGSGTWTGLIPYILNPPRLVPGSRRKELNYLHWRKRLVCHC